MPEPALTYCGNVHPAEDLEGWIATLGTWSAKVAVGRARPFGLGAWWTAATARRLAEDPGARELVRSELARHGLTLATLNVFPFAGFHEAVVGPRVYLPSWAEEDRVEYTKNAAEAVVHFVAAGSTIPLSTLPLGYEPNGAPRLDRRKCARNLARIASAFADLEARTGVRAVLALEPEPMCVLETIAATVAFLEDWVFRAGAWVTVPEAVLRRHLGVCMDLCHLAVVREDALEAAALCRSREVTIAKVQVSSGLELRDGSALDRLLAYDEARYLHQTVADSGARALDLAEVRARRGEFERGGVVRTHFHVPVFWDDPGPLGSTSRTIATTLRGWVGALPLLEVETYTWGVLPDSVLARTDLVAGLRHELEHVARLISI